VKKRGDIDVILNFLKKFDNKKILLIAKEAGLNILKHTNGGEFRFKELEDRFELVFEDFSNSINLKAFKRGYSSTNTLGIGLVLLLNISDEVEIIPKREGKIFRFVVYKIEKKEYCVFSKKFDDIKAFLKVYPFLTITTSGDCGIFEKVDGGYYFALWDIAGHGNKEVYNYSKMLKKYILAFRYFELEEIIDIISHLFKKRAALVIGRIYDKIMFYHFGNIRYIYKNKIHLLENGYLGENTKGEKIELLRDDINFFTDGIFVNKVITTYKELSRVIRERDNDDAAILVILNRKSE